LSWFKSTNEHKAYKLFVVVFFSSITLPSAAYAGFTCYTHRRKTQREETLIERLGGDKSWGRGGLGPNKTTAKRREPLIIY
jgi:hypothetical protein